jgi:NAD(P)-dependent dehydrogenase (short-subunit alcohol dehydrogenase family)
VAADLGSLDGVRRLTGELLDAYGRPDVLLANAGGLYAERRTTLTATRPSLAGEPARHLPAGPRPAVRAGSSRLVHVSTAACDGRPAFDDPQSERSYRGMDVYGRTKLYGAAALLDLSRERSDIHLVLTIRRERAPA